MRVTVVLLLIATCVLAKRSSGKTTVTGTPATDEPPREDGFRKRLNSTTVNRFRKWRQARATQFQENFQKLNDTEKKHLNARLKNLTKDHFERFRPRGDTIFEINNNDQAAEELYQSDIALTEEQLEAIIGGATLAVEPAGSSRQKRTAAWVSATIWPGTIPFTLDSSLSSKAIQAIRDGISFWQANTCVRFQENGSGSNRLRFFRGSGCYSFVGRTGSTAQDVSIGDGCEYVDVTTHEIAHAMGILHEMARFDRDNYVTINVNNIQSGNADNFDKYPQNQVNTFSQAFDISSVMQYGPYGFAKSSSTPVIVAKDANYQYSMGFYQPSIKDIFVVNSLYNCFARCSTAISCQNGGLQNPNSCSVCICPPGFGGNLCQDRASGCGETVTVTGTTRTYSIPQLGNFNDGTVSATVTRCSYFFKPASGFNKVKVTVKSLNAVCDSSCVYAGVDIYTHNNPRDAGYRFCCSSQTPTIISEGPLVRVVAFRRVYGMSAVLEFTAVNDGTTTSPSSNSCADSSTYCADWNTNGFCSSSSYTAATKEAYCAKTCGICSSTSGSGSSSGSGSGSATTTTTTTKAACTDANTSCADWNSNGFCASSAYTAATKSAYCKKTCNMC